ncbi:MAG: thioredoxin-related protein [Lentisphaeria bacterium]|jgi:thioredoxin-related protein
MSDPAVENTPIKENNTPSKPIKKWLTWASYLAIPVIFYFANVEFQSYLGRQALSNIGIELLNIDQAMTKAAAENKYVLADMSAIWCATCRKLDSEVFSDERVKKAINERFVFARVEYESDEGESFMERYQVQAFPTVLVLDSEGKKLSRLPFTLDPEAFIEILKKIPSSST